MNGGLNLKNSFELEYLKKAVYLQLKVTHIQYNEKTKIFQILFFLAPSFGYASPGITKVAFPSAPAYTSFAAPAITKFAGEFLEIVFYIARWDI